MPKQYLYHATEDTSRLTQEDSTCLVDDTACSLVSQTLAEAVAEEIVDNILDDALNLVCPYSGTLSVQECLNIGHIQIDGHGYTDTCISQVNDFNDSLIIDHSELIASTCCNIISEIEKTSIMLPVEENTQEKCQNLIDENNHTTQEVKELVDYFTEINNTGLLGSAVITNESGPNENEHNDMIEEVKRAVQDIINGVLDTPIMDGQGDVVVNEFLPVFDVTVDKRNIIDADETSNDRINNEAENNTIIYESGHDTIDKSLNNTFVVEIGNHPIVYETERVYQGEIAIKDNHINEELEPQCTTCNMKLKSRRHFSPAVCLWGEEEDEVEVQVIFHEEDDFQDVKSKELMNYCTTLEKEVNYLKSDFVKDATDIVNDIVNKAMRCALTKNEKGEKRLSHSADIIQESLDNTAVTKSQVKSQTTISKKFVDDLNAQTSSSEKAERKLVISGGIGDVKVCCGIDNQATSMQETACCSCPNKCLPDLNAPGNASEVTDNSMDPVDKKKRKSKKWKLGGRVRKFFASAIRRNQSATEPL